MQEFNGKVPNMKETDLIDLEIVDALQADPAAPWKEVAHKAGLSEATVSRRWATLSQHGHAWTGMAYHPLRSRGFFVEIGVWGNQRDECADLLSQRKNVITVGTTTGDYNLFCIVIAESIEDLAAEFYNSFTELQLATTYRVSAFGHISGGVHWRQGLLADSSPRRPAPLDGRYLSEELTEDDKRVFELLSCDGRLPYAAIGKSLNITTAQAKRSVNKLISHGHGLFRCDVARPLFDYPLGLVVLGRCPIDQVEEAADFFGEWRETRFCASVISETNLILVLSLHSLGNGNDLLKRIDKAPVQVHVVEYRLIPQMRKTYGMILRPDGQAKQAVPISPWSTRTSEN